MNSSPLRFECTQCGDCCFTRGEFSHIYLGEDELERIADFVGMPKQEFRLRYTLRDKLGWNELIFIDRHCVFLDTETNRCSVHEVRPSQCRTYPFWRELVEDGKWTKEIRSMCEGTGRGKEYSAEAAEALIVEQEEADEG